MGLFMFLDETHPGYLAGLEIADGDLEIAQSGGCEPEPFRQGKFDRIFRENDIFGKRRLRSVMRHHGVEVLICHAFQAESIAGG